MNKAMKKILYTLTLGFIMLSCTDPNQKEIFGGVALGALKSDYIVDSAQGSVHVDVVSTTSYDITSAAYWISTPATASGRNGFDVTYQANEGVARVATIYVSIPGELIDTLYIRQKGALVPVLEALSPNVSLNGSSSGEETVVLSTNLRDDEIVAHAEFASGVDSWITDVKLEGSRIDFSYKANPDTHIRTARICLDYVDENGADACEVIYISQKGSDNQNATVVSVSELRSASSATPTVIEEDWILEGVVVSNKDSGNMGDNTQLSLIGIDYSVSQRTVYVQSQDGTCGIMLLTQTAQDNDFKQFDKVRIALRGRTLCGATVLDAQKEPYYCWIEGIKATDVIMVQPGVQVPVKEKYISELTDDDIFTYVTLKDCELSVRKGSLTPINEKMTNASSVNKISKYALSLHDKQGSSIYIYTNTTCPYRRDGCRLPYGSGKMKGVVVHERYSRYVFQDNASGDEDTYGNIGRYQIRHTSRADFDMAQERSEGDFSEILAEWRYILAQNVEKYQATDGDKSAYFTHSFKHSVKFYDDFSYLGPIGTTEGGFFGKNVGNINGLGIILEDGTDWMGPNFDGLNSENAYKVNNTGNGMGAGISPSGIGASWYTDVNWDNNEKKPQGLILNFSTKNVNSDRMSLHLSMMSVITSGGFTGPRLFNVDYSLDRSQWTTVDSFIISDYGGTNSNPVTQLWQTAGYIPHTIELPADKLCGRDKVYIRIFPDQQMIIGSYTEYITTGAPTNSYPRTAYNYIGIRYNK